MEDNTNRICYYDPENFTMHGTGDSRMKICTESEWFQNLHRLEQQAVIGLWNYLAFGLTAIFNDPHASSLSDSMGGSSLIPSTKTQKISPLNVFLDPVSCRDLEIFQAFEEELITFHLTQILSEKKLI